VSKKSISWIKYTILRRAILEKTVDRKPYTLVAIKNLASLLEGRTAEELKEIHKEWIGYV